LRGRGSGSPGAPLADPARSDESSSSEYGADSSRPCAVNPRGRVGGSEKPEDRVRSEWRRTSKEEKTYFSGHGRIRLNVVNQRSAYRSIGWRGHSGRPRGVAIPPGIRVPRAADSSAMDSVTSYSMGG